MTKTPEQLVDETSAWWTTEIIDIHPGSIAMRGYPIQELIGEIGFAEMVWLMLRGELPTREQAALLEATMVAGVDHGPHAPSIAISRMAVTCGLPINGAMASAINVLDDIHGGAGQQCMELYLEIDKAMSEGETAESAAAAAVARWRDAGTKIIPGFGHRFHPLDPRTPRLLQLLDDACAKGVVPGRFAAIGKAVEAVLSKAKGKTIPMNVDGATAVIYCELGFAPELGRGIFILSRAVGVLAHAWEQKRQGGRIKGPMPPSIPFRYAGPARRALNGRR